MPRRQRFKPSRKPKPAIDPSDQDVIIPASKPTSEQEAREMTAGQHADVGSQVRHPDDLEDRAPR